MRIRQALNVNIIKVMFIGIVFTATTFVAVCEENRLKHPEFVQVWRQNADKGDSTSQERLGGWYCFIENNYSEGLKWYLKAALQENAEAQYMLGKSYIVGEVVEKNEAEGIKWMLKSASNGHPLAQFRISCAYRVGLYVEKDITESIKWFQKSAAQDCSEAQYFLGNAFAVGDGVASNTSESISWYRKAAKQGNADAQFALGKVYFHGQGVPKDQAEAESWFLLAATQGHAYAQYYTASYFFFAYTGEKSFSQALHWYRRSAQQGNIDAQLSLTLLYLHGQGTVTDPLEAYKWCLLAAAGGNLDAASLISSFKETLTPDEQQVAIVWAKKWVPIKEEPNKQELHLKQLRPDESLSKPEIQSEYKNIDQKDTTAAIHQVVPPTRQEINWVEIVLKYGVKIRLPSNWVAYNKEEKKSLVAFAQSYPDKECSAYLSNALSFAARCEDDNGIPFATVNVLFEPFNIAPTSDGNLSEKRINAIGKGCREGFETAGKLAGYNILEWHGPQKRIINGLITYVMEYRRSGPPPIGSSRVRVIKVYKKVESFTLLVSYVENYASAVELVCNQIIDSIKQ